MSQQNIYSPKDSCFLQQSTDADDEMQSLGTSVQTGSKLPPKADIWVQSSQQKRFENFETKETITIDIYEKNIQNEPSVLITLNDSSSEEIDISNVQSSSSYSNAALKKKKQREKMTKSETNKEREKAKTRMIKTRGQMTEEEKNDERVKAKQRMLLTRGQMTEEEQKDEREKAKQRMLLTRGQMTEEEQNDEREKAKQRMLLLREHMTDDDLEQKRESDRNRKNIRKRKRTEYGTLFLAAADHKKANFYELGQNNIECKCGALHFSNEKNSLFSNGDDTFYRCCRDGKLMNLAEGIEKYPEELKVLYFVDNPYHKNFITNIRRFNSSFACASISCLRYNFPTNGPPCYKIQGQIYHKFNTTATPLNENDIPTNGQLYFLDTQEATEVRCELDNKCDPNLTNYIENYIREHNKFAQSYKLMKEIYQEQKEFSEKQGIEMPKIKMLFSLSDQYDKRRYNIPQSNEVCAIIVCDSNDDVPPARIVVQPKAKKELIDIYPLDKSIEPMCYPLLYPTKTEGYHYGLKDTIGKKISLCDYVKFHLFFRDNGIFFPHFYAGKLFQQWVVDMASRIEWDRLEYIRTHQTELCRSNYSNVEDFLNKKAAKTGAEIQKKIILPSSYTGSPRNMHEHFMDAMAIVNETGKPDIFVTYTCNPKDPDILNNLKPNQTPSDRPDIVSRVFEIKKNHLLNLIIKDKIFGEVIGYCWVIEYQKRGLPHMHLLVTLHPNSKWHTKADIDKFIWARIPEKNEEPELYDIVTNCMMHGPCNEQSLCWDKIKKRCKKRFPKPFTEETQLNDDGYPHYKRPNNGLYIWKKGQKLSNQYVVPYSPYLSKTFKAHINVERVADINAVKYIYDYIYKGYDAATIECIQECTDGSKKILKYDEVGKYLEARFLSPCEACYRIFKFSLQGKSHSVDQLDVHLENKQNVFYKKNATEEEISEASERDTTLTAYFKFCQQNPDLNYKYKEMPKHCTWVKKDRKWKIRTERGIKKIGRMIPVNPIATEKYYLYYLLLHKKGTNFKDLKTIDSIEYESFAQACLALGIVRDDDEWRKCMEEACLFSRKHPHGLRVLFVNILVHCGPKYPEKLWDEFKDHMVNDLKRKFTHLTMEKIYEHGLKLINKSLKFQDKSLSDFVGMPQIVNNDGVIDDDDLYDPKEELEIAERLINMMNKEQKEIIYELREAIEKVGIQKLLFIDGPGGSGKSFVLKTIYHLARANNKRVCNVAFSGIAATNLPKGRTLHNRFKLPLNIKKNSTSGIENGGKEANEIKETDIFIWDEAPMCPRYMLDMIEQKMRELMNTNEFFGKKIFILAGDKRQILPIKEFATRTEIIDLLINKSPLWTHFKTMKLSENMRADKNEREFSRQLIEIGDGKAGKNGYINVPDQCICNNSLVNEIFGEILSKNEFNKISEHAILSPFNRIVDNYNDEVMEIFPGEFHAYLSTDETDPTSNLPITPDILNSLKCTSLPNHMLKIKVNSMLMLLRNLNIREGLCNGSRLQVIEPGKHVLKCLIQNGDKMGESTLIPRVTLIEDKKFPFILRRTQFPVKPAFAFTINKSQSQTFSKIGLDYRDDPFTHGHTYTAISRARSWNGIKIILADDNKEKKIKNIVWEEALN